MAEQRTISRDEVAAIIRRIGIVGADGSFVDRAHALNADLVAQLGRLPDAFGKDIEPAHVFTMPWHQAAGTR